MSTILERFEELLENPTPPVVFEFKSFLRSQPIHSVLENSETIMIHKDSADYLNEIYKTGVLTVEQMKVELDKINRVIEALSEEKIPLLAEVHNSLIEAKSTLESTIAIKDSDEYLLETTIKHFEDKEERFNKQLTEMVVSESFEGPNRLFFNTLTESLEAQFSKELLYLSKINTDEELYQRMCNIGKIVAKYDEVYEDSVIFEAGGVKAKVKKAAIKADEKSRKMTNKIRKNAKETKRIANIAGRAGGRIGNLVTKTLTDLKEMDDDARRQAIATGGLYKRVFKVLRTVVMTGAIAYFSQVAAAVFIVVTIALNKRTDKRIRDAILTDLKSEIKIIEEKIRDADSNGDKKAKYQLMRLQTKLEKEVVRIETNNRNIKPMNQKELKNLKK